MFGESKTPHKQPQKNYRKPSPLKPKRKVKNGKMKKLAQNLMPRHKIRDKDFEWLITIEWKKRKKKREKEKLSDTHRVQNRNGEEGVIETEMNRKSKKEGEK